MSVPSSEANAMKHIIIVGGGVMGIAASLEMIATHKVTLVDVDKEPTLESAGVDHSKVIRVFHLDGETCQRVCSSMDHRSVLFYALHPMWSCLGRYGRALQRVSYSMPCPILVGSERLRDSVG